MPSKAKKNKLSVCHDSIALLMQFQTNLHSGSLFADFLGMQRGERVRVA